MSLSNSLRLRKLFIKDQLEAMNFIGTADDDGFEKTCFYNAYATNVYTINNSSYEETNKEAATPANPDETPADFCVGCDDCVYRGVVWACAGADRADAAAIGDDL